MATRTRWSRVTDPRLRARLLARATEEQIAAWAPVGLVTAADVPAVKAAHRVRPEFVASLAYHPHQVETAVPLLEHVHATELGSLLFRWKHSFMKYPQSRSRPVPECRTRSSTPSWSAPSRPGRGAGGAAGRKGALGHVGLGAGRLVAAVLRPGLAHPGCGARATPVRLGLISADARGNRFLQSAALFGGPALRTPLPLSKEVAISPGPDAARSALTDQPSASAAGATYRRPRERSRRPRRRAGVESRVASVRACSRVPTDRPPCVRSGRGLRRASAAGASTGSPALRARARRTRRIPRPCRAGGTGH